MSWTCDEVVAVLGEDAQIVAGGIVVLHHDETLGRYRHVQVATLSGNSFVVTEEGLEILELREKPKAAPKKDAPKAAPKKGVAKVAEPAAGGISLDDLDMGSDPE